MRLNFSEGQFFVFEQGKKEAVDTITNRVHHRYLHQFFKARDLTRNRGHHHLAVAGSVKLQQCGVGVLSKIVRCICKFEAAALARCEVSRTVWFEAVARY